MNQGFNHIPSFCPFPPPPLPFGERKMVKDVARRVIDAGAGLSLGGLSTGNIGAGEMRNAVADLVADPAYRSSAEVLSGVLR